MKVFVTDGDQRPALAVTQSLGRRGIEVVVGAAERGSLAAASKYCRDEVIYPSPSHHPDRFAQFLLDLVKRDQIDVVLPVTDVTTYVISTHAAALAPYAATPTPSLDAFEAMTDKSRLMQRAEACGIAIPRTLFVERASALPTVLDRVSYPAVVKPSRSRIPTADGWVSASVRYARSEEELRALYRDVTVLNQHPSLIQEWVVGHGTGVFALCDHGRIVASFSHRRLREKPPSGGASVLCESIAIEPAQLDEASLLLGPLGWHGVAMLEYKEDQRTGRRYLMEVNGRFWGSLQLAIDAGVDFPYLAWQLARGERPAAPASYAIGIRNRWLLGDLDHLLSRMLHDNHDLPDDAPSRGQAVLDFLNCRSDHQHDEIARRDDLGPAWREFLGYGHEIAQSIGARLNPWSQRSAVRRMRRRAAAQP